MCKITRSTKLNGFLSISTRWVAMPPVVVCCPQGKWAVAEFHGLGRPWYWGMANQAPWGHPSSMPKISTTPEIAMIWKGFGYTFQIHFFLGTTYLFVKNSWGFHCFERHFYPFFRIVASFPWTDILERLDSMWLELRCDPTRPWRVSMVGMLVPLKGGI